MFCSVLFCSPNLFTVLSCDTLGTGILLVPSDRPFNISIKSRLFPDLAFKSPVKKTSPFSEKKIHLLPESEINLHHTVRV